MENTKEDSNQQSALQQSIQPEKTGNKRPAIWLIAIILICVLLLTILLLTLESDTTNQNQLVPSVTTAISPPLSSQPKRIAHPKTTGWRTYTNSKYGITFDYPSNYTLDGPVNQSFILKEGTPNQTKDILITAITASGSAQLNKPFIDFAEEQALCTPLGLNGQVWCDKVAQLTPIQNPYGITGYKLYLHRVFGFLGSGTPDDDGIVGPVLAYDVSKYTNNVFREVQITPDLYTYTNVVDPAILNQIGDSLRFSK